MSEWRLTSLREYDTENHTENQSKAENWENKEYK